ncbi:secreted protein [Melampsora americana]|nr:secreted protein [Melampsora americana]
MFSSIFLASLICLHVLLIPHHTVQAGVHANRYGAGQIDNSKKQHSMMQACAHPQGDFYMQNFATKAWLSYHRNPQTIQPTIASKRSVISLSNYGPGTRVRPRSSNNKCLASQFHSETGVDWAATMYVCSTSHTQKVDAGNPINKQQWLFIPVHNRRDTYYLVAVDHLNDMQTRALSSRTLQTAGGYISTSMDLFNTRDPTQMWKLVKA